MFDGVFNHVSAKSKWFQGFVNGDPEFQDFFIAFGTRDAIDPDAPRQLDPIGVLLATSAKVRTW